MKFYISFAFVFISLLSGLGAKAQVVIKDVKELPVDLYARINDRQNDKGEKLAVIKLAIPSVQGLDFVNNVGNVAQEQGEYIIYLNPGTQYLTILSNNEPLSTINFADWNVEIKPQTTYQAILSLEQLREIGFKVEPADAVLTINDEVMELSSDGSLNFAYQPGVMYQYKVEAPGYLTLEDSFFIDEDESQEEIEAISVMLEPHTSKVTINTNVGNKDIDVYVGNNHIQTIKNGGSVELPVGVQYLRIVADGYNDWANNFTVRDYPTSVDLTLVKQKEQTISHIRSRWGMYAGAGISFGQKFEGQKMTGFPIRIGFEFDYFITRNFTFRPEVEAFIYAGKDFRRENSKEEKSTPFALDLAFPFNLNIPLSRYNLHFFTLGVGPIIGFLSSNSPQSADAVSHTMYGGRVEARFYLNKFTFGATLDYQGFAKNKKKEKFTDKGIWVPTVVIGYMFK